MAAQVCAGSGRRIKPVAPGALPRHASLAHQSSLQAGHRGTVAPPGSKKVTLTKLDRVTF